MGRKKWKRRVGKGLGTGCILLSTFIYPLSTTLLAQSISIKLTKPASALIRVDSANWNEAWITLEGASPLSKKLDTADLLVTDGERIAKVISVDSVGCRGLPLPASPASSPRATPAISSRSSSPPSISPHTAVATTSTPSAARQPS